MKWFGLGAIVAGAMLGSFALACGSMEETAPGVYQGSGKYDGAYRLAEPGEAADVKVTTYSPGDSEDFGDFGELGFSNGGSFRTVGYVKLIPSDLANMTEAEKKEAQEQAETAAPQPPPMYQVGPSHLKLKAEMPKEAKPKKATQKADEEDLILI